MAAWNIVHMHSLARLFSAHCDLHIRLVKDCDISCV